jgi:cyclophilin family peptidyl-prolyl cis-trans isomerase
MDIRRAGWCLFGLVICMGPIGCSGKSTGRPAPAVSIPSQADETAPTEETPQPRPAPKAVPFAEAVTEDSPDEQLPPPDQTFNGLSTGKIRVAVQKAWDGIVFTTPAGKKLAYTAVLDTELGPITIALRPDVAPNHVRNFVALARAGFYNGLVFERVIEQQGDGPDSKLELIEGGCPLGTGEPGIGHLGYWLNPEFSDTVKHEPGTVGACLNGAEDSAGCRFYMTLSSAPAMDASFTVFGKVTTGLDVVRTIAKQPRPDGSTRPNTPVVIRKATIQTQEVP